jgi:hypothetical protein
MRKGGDNGAEGIPEMKKKLFSLSFDGSHNSNITITVRIRVM